MSLNLVSACEYFRKVYRDQEQAFESSVLLYHNASPGDIGVADKLFPKDPTVLQGSYPYESAVQELKLLCNDCCPQKKLECIGEITPLLLWFIGGII